ncbi:MAG: preprotein translocase subunit Sec61beta [Nitrososphaerota archaeon]
MRGLAARRRRGAPLPASAAGLLRFFEEEAKGVKIRPEIILILASLLIAVTIIMNKLIP